jgi:hypothetical protein
VPIPAGAAHERNRATKLKRKAGKVGTHRSAQHKRKAEGTATYYIAKFPDQTFVLIKNKIYCDACSCNVFCILSTIKNHVNSAKHKGKLKLCHKTEDNDNKLQEQIRTHFILHPHEKQGTVDTQLQVFRYRTVETLLVSGTAMNKSGWFRALLQRNHGQDIGEKI